jgi:hypothetical protein
MPRLGSTDDFFLVQFCTVHGAGVEPEAILPRGASAFARGPTGQIVGIKIGFSVDPKAVELIFQLPYIERIVLSADPELKVSVPETVTGLKRLTLLWLFGFHTLPRQILELDLPLRVLESRLSEPDEPSVKERMTQLEALMG